MATGTPSASWPSSRRPAGASSTRPLTSGSWRRERRAGPSLSLALRKYKQVGRRPVSAREHNTAAVAQLISQSVRNTDGRISAKRLLPLAKKDGYTGSARNFRRAVAEAKAGWKKERRTYRPWVPVPGQYLMI